jgi:hypothetical protein
VVATRSLQGYVVAKQQDRDREVLLVLGFHRRAAWRLVVVDARGGVRSVAVNLPSARYSNAGFTAVGLAVDPDGNRAFLLPGGGAIATVNLNQLTVRYRRWPTRSAYRWKAYARSPKNHASDPIGPRIRTKRLEVAAKRLFALDGELRARARLKSGTGLRSSSNPATGCREALVRVRWIRRGP